MSRPADEDPPLAHRHRLPELLAQVDAPGPAARHEPGACEAWSVKDILAHLDAWHELFLGLGAGGRPVVGCRTCPQPATPGRTRPPSTRPSGSARATMPGTMSAHVWTSPDGGSRTSSRATTMPRSSRSAATAGRARPRSAATPSRRPPATTSGPPGSSAASRGRARPDVDIDNTGIDPCLSFARWRHRDAAARCRAHRRAGTGIALRSAGHRSSSRCGRRSTRHPRGRGLRVQNEDGSWGDASDPRRRVLSSLWMAKALSELGVDDGHPRWHRAAEFLADVSHTRSGVLGLDGRDASVLSCYAGIAAEMYLLGGRPDLARPQIEWILRYQDVRVRGRMVRQSSGPDLERRAQDPLRRLPRRYDLPHRPGQDGPGAAGAGPSTSPTTTLRADGHHP